MTPHLQTLLDTFAGDVPLARARTIPSAWYHDPEMYELECRRVFGASWQLVGRLDQVAGPGAFVTADVAGEPILVVRDENRELHAFHNVCRHRAAQVINQPEGTVTKLRCRYHGWTYDLAGRLRGTPEFDGVQDFRKENEGLVPLRVATSGPFVFVHQGEPKQSLVDFLTPFPERTSTLGLEKLRFVQRRSYEINCNWKVFVDNYQDGGYHVNTVHPSLAGVLDYAHYRTENFANASVQVSPIKTSDDAAVAQVRAGSHAYYWWIFPNLMINIYQGIMDTNLVLPLGPDRCRVFFDFYFAAVEGEENQKFIAKSLEVAHQVQLEDMAVCQEVQQGLRSRSYDTGRFSVKRESGGYHFHQLLADWLRDESGEGRGASGEQVSTSAGFPPSPLRGRGVGGEGSDARDT